MRKKEEQALLNQLAEAQQRIGELEHKVTAVVVRTEEVARAVDKPVVNPDIEKGAVHGHLPDNMPFDPDS